jgi:polysaccharide export outer membrane protein
MKRTLYFFFVSLLIIIIASCARPLSEVTYMNEIEQGIYPDGPVPDDYKIRVNDQLYIQVIADDPMNAAFLNLIQPDRANVSGNNTELITYIVDENGDIYFLLLGKIHVEGMTVKEIRKLLQEKVDQYLDNTAVFVKLVGRNITVLGEVDMPGQHEMVKNRLNIFEALGSAGDITDWGNYEEVMLIRETPEGKQVAYIDLLDPELIDSPYYYILPNDVLYVKLNNKVRGTKNVKPFTGIMLALSIISTALLVANLFVK